MTLASAVMLATRSVRRAHRVTQDDLGERLECTSRETICRRETDPHGVALHVVDDHVAACGGSMAEFMSALCSAVGFLPQFTVEIAFETYREQLARAAMEEK